MLVKNTLKWIFILFSTVLTSQNYKLLDTTTYEQRKKLMISYENSFELINSNLKNQHSRKMHKSLIEIHEDYQEDLLSNFKDNNFIINKKLDDFIGQVIDTVCSKNKNLKELGVKFLISKETNPNSITLPDGTIVVNLGLFSLLENEYQIAAVLCHEIAHHVLDHGNKIILEKVNEKQSRDLALKTKEIKKNKYNKNVKALEFYKSILVQKSTQSKISEYEADSLGYIFFKNTYNPIHEYIEALYTLKDFSDYIDEIKSIQTIDTINYKLLFDLPSQKFKSEWLAEEDFNDYDYNFFKEKIITDSIDTHPEIDKRVNKLKGIFKELMDNADFENLEASNAFKQIQLIAVYEQIPNLYHFEDYGISIYTILKMINKKEYDEEFLKEWLGYNFRKLEEAKKAYTFNRYVDQLNPKDQSTTYLQFINFLWNLNLEEIKNIADYYSKVEHIN